jgi:hypothetical protein
MVGFITTLSSASATEASDQRLDEYRVSIAPYDRLAEGTRSCMKLDDLLVLLAVGAMIKADHHSAAITVSRASDEN